MEICGSTACARRCSSSTSGWSWASESTRAMTRRCSVMRMPFSTQSVSMRSDKRGSRVLVRDKIGLSGGRVKVETHHQGVHDPLGAAVVVGLAQAGLAESEAVVECDGRIVVDRDLKEDLGGAERAGGRQRGGQQGAGHALATRAGRHADRQDLHLAGGDAAEDEAERRGL